jgi:hypothetical protein
MIHSALQHIFIFFKLHNMPAEQRPTILGNDSFGSSGQF